MCDDNGSKFSTRLWNNCEGHVFQIRADAKIASKLGLTLEGEKVEGSKRNLQDEAQPNDLSEDDPEIQNPYIDHELDFVFTKFILENRLPFRIAQPLNNLINQITSHYSLSSIQNHSTSREIITDVTKAIAETLKIDVFKELKSPFPLSVDSSSDIHGNTFLTICARFLAEDNPETSVVKLLQVLLLIVSSTGEVLFDKIDQSILIDEDIKNNFMGLATDNAKT